MRWVELLGAVGLPAAGWAVIRRARERRLERVVAVRLGAPGAHGIVAGAEPIALDAGPRAALLLHGFGDTPESLAGLARFLHARGWTVRVPLLPGHGRTVRAFATSTAAEWEGAAREAHATLARSGRPVALVGQSMGAALAVRLAADHPTVPAMVLLAPLLSLSPRLEQGARWWRLVSLVRPLVDSAEDRSIHDPTARAASRGYGVMPARLLPQLAALVRAARADLPRVHTPTRVVQSREDNRVTVAGTEEAVRLFGSSALEVVWRSGAGHVVSVDSGHEDVWALTAEWLERQVVAERLHSA